MTTTITQTIQTWLDEGNHRAILAWADAAITQRNNAEDKNRAYLHEIKLLAERFAAITEPLSGRLVSEPQATRVTEGDPGRDGRDGPSRAKRVQGPTERQPRRGGTAITIDL